MKFIQVENRIINIEYIVELSYFQRTDEHFNRIGWEYYLVVRGGMGICKISKEQYEEIKNILLNLKYDDAE